MPTTTLSRNRRILAATARGFAQGLIKRRPEFRRHVVRDAWTIAKRFGAEDIDTIEFREIPCLQDAVVDAYVDDRQRAIIAALVRGLDATTFFEIGTNRGRTTWTVAAHNPGLTLYTLDLAPSPTDTDTAYELADDDRTYLRPATACGEAFHDTPEAQRITQLWGDSATFDYAPYAGRIDFVYIDGAHTCEYVKSDTANALRLLSPSGTIAWDDYATGPGVYEALIDLAPTLDRPVYHLLETRMAIYSRRDFVVRVRDNFPF
jgi:predicted O-methyltransferase YrrM